MVLHDQAALERLGRALAAQVQPGDVLALAGPLGVGKSTLARAILTALGLREEAPSPTFTLCQLYEAPPLRLPVWHVDLYRLEGPLEARQLGLDEAAEYATLLIEWPERLGAELDPDRLWLQMAFAGEGRSIVADVPPVWRTRWERVRTDI